LKFGGYIYRVNLNKSPLKILEKRERGRIQGLPILGFPHFLRGKATDFKFGVYIYRTNPNKSPLFFLEKGAWAYPGTARFLGDTPYYLRNG